MVVMKKVKGFPAHLVGKQRGGGHNKGVSKFDPYFAEIATLQVGETGVIVCPNKVFSHSLTSYIQGKRGQGIRAKLNLGVGERFAVRTEPVNGNRLGEWKVYIQKLNALME